MLISTPLALYNIINDHVNNKMLMGPFVPLPCVYPNKGRSCMVVICLYSSFYSNPLNLVYLVDSIDICMIFDDGLVPSSNWRRSLMPGLWNATVV